MNAAPPRFRFADLTLDLGQRRVSRETVAVRLGRLSYEMLRTLVLAAPNVVSHQQFERDVWRGRPVSPETLSQRVKLLRDALSDEGRCPRYIGLARGHGYRLIPPVEIVRVPVARAHLAAILPFEHRSEPVTIAEETHEEGAMHLARGQVFALMSATGKRYTAEPTSTPEITSNSRAGGAAAAVDFRAAGNRIRITAQFIDGETGTHLWADTYEYDVSDSHAARIAVAESIAATMSLNRHRRKGA